MMSISFSGVAPNNEEPFRTIYRVAVYLWIFMGLSYISLVIKSLSKIFVKRAKKVKKNALRKVTTQNVSINKVFCIPRKLHKCFPISLPIVNCKFGFIFIKKAKSSDVLIVKDDYLNFTSKSLLLFQSVKNMLDLQFPFMNGITIMNGTTLGKRTINSGKIQRSVNDNSNNEGSDDADDVESHGNKAVSTGNIQAVQLFSAPTTKCRVQLKDVIDLVGPNHHDIKLLKVSTIESRY